MDDLGASVNDLAFLRFLLRDDRLTDELRADLHAVRRGLFEPPRYPAATTIGVSSLDHADAHLGIEAEAFVPSKEREVSVVLPEE